jgi:hypothetical protein
MKELKMTTESFFYWKSQLASHSDKRSPAYPELIESVLNEIIKTLIEIKKTIGKNGQEFTLYPTKAITNEQLLGALEDSIKLAVRTDRSGGSWSYANKLVEILEIVAPDRYAELLDWIWANRANSFVPKQAPFCVTSQMEYESYELSKKLRRLEKEQETQEISRLAKERRKKNAEEHRLRSLENRKRRGFAVPNATMTGDEQS